MNRRIVWYGVVIAIILGGFVMHQRRAGGHYYSIQESRRPCGRIVRRTVERRGDIWLKTVEVMDPSGMFVIARRERAIEKDVCNKIQRGIFVRGLWDDCQPQV